jgi:hypothetical protein
MRQQRERKSSVPGTPFRIVDVKLPLVRAYDKVLSDTLANFLGRETVRPIAEICILRFQ